MKLKLALKIGAILALLIGYRVFFSEEAVTDTPSDQGGGKAAMIITTAQPQRITLPLELKVTGNILPWQEVVIGSDVSGLRLASVRVNVGDVVKKNQILATFINDITQADVMQAKARMMETLALYEKAKSEAARAHSIENTNALSKQQLSHYFTQEKITLAQYEAAQAAYQSAQLRLQYTTVRSPDNGVISARQATVGSVIGMGQELFRLIRQHRLEWQGEATAEEVSHIRVGFPAHVTVPGGRLIDGKVRAISPSADPKTRNILIYVDLPLNAGMTAGTFAQGTIDLGKREGLVVPQQAIVIRDGFSYLFIVDSQRQVSQRKVQTGLHHDGHVEIISGLEANEWVAIEGAGFLHDGDTVRVVN